MILTKYRMLLPNGYIETLNIQEAIDFSNYVIVNEEIEDGI